MIRLESLKQAAGVIDRYDRIAVLAHEKPDGDALGSALGLVHILRSSGKSADAFLPESIPAKYETLAGTDYLNSMNRAMLTRDYDLMVVLDCASSERIALGSRLELGDLGIPVLGIDHHDSNTLEADWLYVDGKCAATAELVCRMAESAKWQISAEAATMLLLGLITDTGSFRFSNTNSSALQTAGRLHEYGAEWDKVVNTAFFSKPFNQLQFETDLIQHHVKSACNGRYLYGMITDELLKKHNFDMRDGEAVIDLLREVSGVMIAALLYPSKGKVKLSMRSKDKDYPVGPIARKFGGGGHLMAAGASVDTTPEEAEKLLLEAVTETLDK